MCICLFALGQSAEFPFILAHNRDEYFDRPFTPAAEWPGKRRVWAGRDHPSQGMWLGVDGLTRRFAALTSFRDRRTYRSDAPTRGGIVREFLLGGAQATEYAAELERNRNLYNPYNLIFGTPEAVHWFSSRTGELASVKPGLHGISNHLLNTDWPKVLRGKDLFSAALRGAPDLESLKSGLFAVLADSERADPEYLPDTGLEPERELALSSIFVASPVYGTLSSTILIGDRARRLYFFERCFGPSGVLTHESSQVLSPKGI